MHCGKATVSSLCRNNLQRRYFWTLQNSSINFAVGLTFKYFVLCFLFKHCTICVVLIITWNTYNCDLLWRNREQGASEWFQIVQTNSVCYYLSCTELHFFVLIEMHRMDEWFSVPKFSKPLVSTTFTLHRIFYCIASTWVVIGCQRDLLLLERLLWMNLRRRQCKEMHSSKVYRIRL